MRLRHRLKNSMAGEWLLTWHENGGIQPGVPDLSYVLLSPGHETGWLELKATDDILGNKPKKLFKLESHQHQWIDAHWYLIPVHILCAVEDIWYLIPGVHHESIDEPLTAESLRSLSVIGFHYADCSQILTIALKSATRRDRESKFS